MGRGYRDHLQAKRRDPSNYPGGHCMIQGSSAGPEEQFQAAKRRHQAGRQAEAEAAYRALLREVPHHPEALHFLALLLGETGRDGEAVHLLRQAIGLRGDQPGWHNNLGELLRRQGRLEEAIVCFRTALALDPVLPEAHHNLGTALKAQGEHDEAIACFHRALTLRPDYAGARYNLANALREQGRVAEAVMEYQRALVSHPDWRDALLNLGNAFQELGEPDAAVAHYLRAQALSPDDPPVDANLGAAYLAQGRLDAAAACFRRDVSRHPSDWLRELRLAALAPPIAPGNAAIDEYRAVLAMALEDMHTRSRALDAAQLHNSGAEPPMALAYQGRDDLPLKRRYAELFSSVIAPPDPLPNDGLPRIGFVVTHGHEGVFARCMGGLFERLSPQRMRTAVVCSRASVNLLRKLMSDAEVEFFPLPERVDQAAERLRQARFDLLHYWEVGTDSINYFLPFFRPAPVQCATWGWPVTTGMSCMDYFVSCRLLEADSGDAHYSEELVRMERLPTFYTRPPVPSRVSRPLPGVRAGDHVYLCTQNLRKLHPDFDGLLAELLQADPAGRLLLIADKQPGVTELLLRRLRAPLAESFGRVGVVGRLKREKYLALVASADVVLDTLHYSGGANTVCDAMAVGTPVITLPGAFHRGRYTTAAYRLMGIPDLIASSPSEYVRLAVRLAGEPDFRRAMRQRLLEANEVLFEDRGAVEEHEEFFLRAVASRRGVGT
jgi:protein O-GlcNAc transferase